MSHVIETRYASEEMAEIFSDTTKYSTWRMLWADLAEAEKLAGAPISDEQVAELRAHAAIDPRDMALAADLEKETHHDVMAHILVLKKRCPRAAGVIHLGATSCYVTDNTDILQMCEGLEMVCDKTARLIFKMRDLAYEYKDLDCLAYTHYQVAQPTTLGKRIAMWMQDLVMDVETIKGVLDHMKLLGCRGATGACTDLLELVGKDGVRTVEDYLSKKYGLPIFPVSGQTYTRKQDFSVLQALSGLAQSAAKFANDMRLLSHDGEVREPFGGKQVGSSAMPYKKNPMMCERICSLSRYVICNAQNAAMNTATQWLERTLDDSANRRIVIPDVFMVADGILELYTKVVEGLQVDKPTIRRRLEAEAPKVNTEKLLMFCVRLGMDRQEAHEVIRSVMVEEPDDPAHALYLDGRLCLPERAIRRKLLGMEDVSGLAAVQTESFLDSLEEVLHWWPIGTNG